MKLGLLAASLVLVAGGAVGCGDDSGSGSDGGSDNGNGNASSSDEGVATEDFCAAFQAFADDLAGVTGTEGNLGEILKKAAQRIEDVGTPDDIPDDAKEGLQLTLDAIQALPDDASAEDMGAIEEEFSEADKEKTDAFSEYLEETCPELGDSGESDSDSGSDSGGPSEDASDEPSDDASDGS
jgi:hypothetical protein